MADEDARSLPGAAQAALRNRAVRAVLDGMTQAQAARVFGVHPNAVNRWIKRYREGGFQGLAEQRRGRRPGEQAALTEPQQQEVIALVRETHPGPAGPGGVSVDPRCGRRADRPALWPCGWRAPRWAAICAAGGSAPSGHSTGPWSRTRPRCAAGWPRSYPAIRAQARREGGVVLWLDEMGVRSDAAAGRSWAPVGQTPVIKRTGKRFRVNMISAISNAGTAAVPAVCRVVHRAGVHRLPAAGCCAIAAGGRCT